MALLMISPFILIIMTALIEQLTVRIRNCIIDVSLDTSNIWSAIQNYATGFYPLNTIKYAYACALYKIIALNKFIVGLC